MTQAPKPDLTDHEEEAAPFDDVLRQLLEAKPAPKQAPASKRPFGNEFGMSPGGLDGRARCDSKQVFEALLETDAPCGPRPPARSIAALAYAMEVI